MCKRKGKDQLGDWLHKSSSWSLTGNHDCLEHSRLHRAAGNQVGIVQHICLHPFHAMPHLRATHVLSSPRLHVHFSMVEKLMHVTQRKSQFCCSVLLW